jgi:hypothetical protein
MILQWDNYSVRESENFKTARRLPCRLPYSLKIMPPQGRHFNVSDPAMMDLLEQQAQQVFPARRLA